ncbi:tRNA 2-thiouridine synthesizing protein E [Marinobacter mobilis]|uniref:Sulfurtransferase n=2 Tax=Marinobacter mobilis TaxID=488533 RepID=A0A1H2V7C0_9GAMM|nr:tRNA 2-thiouridine synthesizing protein E [Marinobacter mobilis]
MKPMTMPIRNNEGFLEDAGSWTPDVAVQIASEDGIDLLQPHWEVIDFLRSFYQKFDMSPPSNRLFVKAVKEAMGEEKGNSIYLMQLFPGTPAKTACRIAGLPRPTNCL